MAFLSNFLEKMDQSAGEIAQDMNTPSNAPAREEAPEGEESPAMGDVDAIHDRGEEDLVDAGPPVNHHSSEPGSGDEARPSAVGADQEATAQRNAQDQKKVAHLEAQVSKLLRSNEATTKRYEATMEQRDARFDRLQADYDLCMSRLKEIQATGTEKESIYIEVKNENHVLAERGAQLQSKLEDRDNRLEAARDQIFSLETQMQDLQAHVQVAQEERDTAQTAGKGTQAQLSRITLELTDYKAKAQILLAEKDKTIEYLRDGSGPTGASEDPVQENKALLEQLAALKEQKRAELDQLASQMDSQAAQREKDASTISSLEKEVAQANEVADEAKHTAQAANSLYDGEVASHASTRSHLESELAAKEDQLSKMRLKVAAATSAVASGSQAVSVPAPGEVVSNTSAPQSSVLDLERRVKDLSELVMEKQAALESKRSECEQWKTRCEMTQQRLREADMVSSMGVTSAGSSSSNNSNLGLTRTSGHRVVSIEDDRDVQDSLQGDFSRSNFFGGLQRRGAWGQKVVGVAQHLDSVSLKTGGMLKRNSVLRVALILYVLLLHMWVFVVISFSGAGADNSATNVGTSTAVEPKV